MDKVELTRVRSILDRVYSLEAQISVIRKDLEILIRIPKPEPEAPKPEPQRVFKPRNPDLVDSNADYYASFKRNRRR